MATPILTRLGRGSPRDAPSTVSQLHAIIDPESREETVRCCFHSPPWRSR